MKLGEINYRLIAKIIGIIVILAGLTVMFGWFFDITVLKSILPGWVTMKFITAVCFLISGMLIFLFALKNKSETSETLILALSFLLLLLMISFLFSLFFGISTGIESFFIKEDINAVRTSVPGVPAVPTMVCFILIGLAGLFYLANNNNNNNNLIKPFFILGISTTFIGGVAILGYGFSLPQLYYSFPGFTAMAFPTALLFVLIGISLILTAKENKKEVSMNK